MRETEHLQEQPKQVHLGLFLWFEAIWTTFRKPVTDWVYTRTRTRTRTAGNTEPRPDPRPNTPRKKIRRSATPSLRCSIRGNKNGGASTKQFQSSSRIGSASRGSRTHWSFLLRLSLVLQPRFYKEAQQKRKGAEDAARRKRHRRRICMFHSWQQKRRSFNETVSEFEPYWLGLSRLAHSLVLFASAFPCFATQVLQRSTTEEERGRGRSTKKAPQKTNMYQYTPQSG